MGQLMTRSRNVHESSLLDLICLLIDDVTLVAEDASNFILLFLTSDEKDFVLRLDRGKFLRQDVCVPDRDLDCGLGVQLMDEQGLLLFVVVVEARLDRCQDVVGLERDHVMQEASELVHF